MGVLELEGSLKVGDSLIIAASAGDFEQGVDSMQVEHDQVQSAKKGDAVGLKVDKPVKQGNVVYLKG